MHPFKKISLPAGTDTACYDDGNIIFEKTCAQGTPINVLENADYRWLTMGSDLMQSVIRLSAPDEALLPYTQAMLLALAFHQKPQRLLNLGSGCGTFERFLFRHYPDISITSVEPNIDIINISRTYFQCPADHPVSHESAVHFLKHNETKYDVVLCDIHDGKSHPKHFSDVEFYADILHSLNDDAVLVMNIIPGGQQMMLDILFALRKFFNCQYLLDFDHYGNIVLFIYQKEPPALQPGGVLCADLATHLNVDLGDIIDRLTLLPTTLPRL